MDWLPIVFYSVITLAGVSIATAAWYLIRTNKNLTSAPPRWTGAQSSIWQR